MRALALLACVAALAVLALAPASAQGTLEPENVGADGDMYSDTVSGSGWSAALSVKGNQLLRGGKPFIPVGFTQIGLLAPAWCHEQSQAAQKGHTAWGRFNESQMSDIMRWKPNMMRFMISFPGLVWGGEYDCPTCSKQRNQDNIDAYRDAVVERVRMVSSFGVAITLNIQDQEIGCGFARPLPHKAAALALLTLSEWFPHDQYPHIAFELWNEPGNNPSSRGAHPSSKFTVGQPFGGIEDWKSGRTTSISCAHQDTRKDTTHSSHNHHGHTPVDKDKLCLWSPYVPTGHQQLVTAARNVYKIKNVLIVDGSLWARRLDGIANILLSDSLNSIVYAAHAFGYEQLTTRTKSGLKAWDKGGAWDVALAPPALLQNKQHPVPVVINAWNVDCKSTLGVSNSQRSALAAQFFSWAISRKVGVTAWGYDSANTIIQDWHPLSLTDFSDCVGENASGVHYAGGAAFLKYMKRVGSLPGY